MIGKTPELKPGAEFAGSSFLPPQISQNDRYKVFSKNIAHKKAEEEVNEFPPSNQVSGNLCIQMWKLPMDG